MTKRELSIHLDEFVRSGVRLNAQLPYKYKFRLSELVDWGVIHHSNCYTKLNEEFLRRLELLKPPPPKSPKNPINVKDRRRFVLNHYGCKCACCGEQQEKFLEIDHVNNNGAEHRKTVKDIVGWLIQNNFPDGFQLLCSNCNQAKARYGKCPHQG